MSKFTRPEPLAAGEGIEGFCCGDSVVDRWVENHSKTARSRGTAVIYVTRFEGQVAGFYTLTMHSVARESVSGGWFVRNAPNTVPCVLLGMLGVDKQFQRCGLGSQLLRDALERTIKIADMAGARALIVDPSNEGAKAFYARYGFAELSGTSRMALSLLRRS